jgi:replicative DNA helicase
MKEAEARLIRVLVENGEARERVLELVNPESLGETARVVFEEVARRRKDGRPVDYAHLTPHLPDRAREALTELAFRTEPLGGAEEIEACLAALRRERLERDLARLQREIEQTGDASRLDALAREKMDLVRELQGLAGF